MSATLHTTLRQHKPATAPAARLVPKTDGTSRGLLGGARWPRSRDLAGGLPTLTDALDLRWGRVTRVAGDPKCRPVVPPETGAKSAARPMAANSGDAGPPPTALIAEGEARHAVAASGEPLDPDEEWEYEGGALRGVRGRAGTDGPPGRASHLITGR